MNDYCCSDPRCRIFGCAQSPRPQSQQIPPTTTVKWPFPVGCEPQKNLEAEWVRQIVREEIARALAERDSRTATVAPDGEPRQRSE